MSKVNGSNPFLSTIYMIYKENMLLNILFTLALGSTDLIFQNGFETPLQRQPTVFVKYGNKPGMLSCTTEEQVFNISMTAPVQAFPQVGNRSVSFTIGPGQYAALPFLVPTTMSAVSAGSFGAFDTNYLGTPPFPKHINYSISLTPGDFNPSSVCKASWTGQDGEYLVWAAPEVPDAVCKLQRGKTYYLNITTDSDVNATVSMAYFRLQQAANGSIIRQHSK